MNVNTQQSKQMKRHLKTTLSTVELADALNVRPESIRTRFSRYGDYWGIKPVKAPNRLLHWPLDAPERLIGSTKKQGDEVAA
jgi:transcriptional regulator GlxA family with amidase domain